MSFESFPSQTPEAEKEGAQEQPEKGVFQNLMEKHPRSRKTILALATIASTFGAAEKASSAESDRPENITIASHEAESAADHDAFIEEKLGETGDDDFSKDIASIREEFREDHELIEELQEYTYYSVDVTETINNEKGSYTSYLDETEGELPEQAERVAFGSFDTLHIYQNDYGNEEGTDVAIWQGFSEYDALAPANVELEAGDTMTRTGVGVTESEAIESALQEAASFLGSDTQSHQEIITTAGTTMSAEGGSESSAESDFSETIGSNTAHYFYSYDVTSLEKISGEEDGAAKYRAEVEIVTGVPVNPE